MRNILVPIDFSKKSEFAIQIAAKIHKINNCQIYLLYTVELPAGQKDMSSRTRFSIPESMMYLRILRKKMGAIKEDFFPKNDSIHCAIKAKNPFEGIIDYSKRIDADLIIMGSKGISNFDKLIAGSNADRVLIKSEIPVLVVKENARKFKLKKIVFASNFKEENKAVFDKFLAFVKEFKTEIVLLKIITKSKFEPFYETKQQISNFISDFNMPKHTIQIYNDTTVENGILNFSREIKADLIALSTHGRSGLSYLFNGSIAGSVTKKGLSPIITFKI
jgi:nucleotide-binding universal stress UspA family protein